MLISQVLAISVAAVLIDDSGSVPWLWHLDKEFNIPSTLASAQLALVSLIAILTAWNLAVKPRDAWQQVYFVGISILFFHFARDEFFQFRDPLTGWEISYAQLGMVVALATVILSLRLPRQQRMWSVCILAGLALGALGAFFIENLRHADICTALGFMAVKCQIYFLEEALEFLGMWLMLLGVLGFFSAYSRHQGRR